MDLTEYVDRYCERLEPGLLAEPLNLVTNLAFIIAGVVALRQGLRTAPEGTAAATSGPRAPLDSGNRAWLIVLAGIVILMGIGSGLFHSFATRWAGLADVVPIGIYMYTFMGFTVAKLLGGGVLAVLAGLATLFVALWAGAQLPGEYFNGSNGYFGAAACLFLLAALARRRCPPAAAPLLAAALVFCVSLFFRSIDLAVCAALPIGTHFLWHCLNGLLLYLTLRAALVGMRHRQGAATPAE